ncbi:response regulator transcription factor [Galbibacter sp.]|uniref:response regulator transcription factor n=1 Tax=Galbibacter sp. TaxID=2918471 RepID=UPI003A94ABB1
MFNRKDSLLAEIPDIIAFFGHLDATMVTVYHTKEDKIIYCNSCFKDNHSINVKDVFNQGWSNWILMIPLSHRPIVKSRLFNFFGNLDLIHVITLRYPIVDCEGNELSLRHKCLSIQLKKQHVVISYITDVTEEKSIERYLSSKKMHQDTLKKNSEKFISSREKQVLRLIADGLSSKQIANLLFISNHTAISHRKHLIKKFQVKNTAQLIKAASKVIEL